MESKLGGATYRTGRMAPKVQFHVSRRLLPGLVAFGQTAKTLRELAQVFKVAENTDQAIDRMTEKMSGDVLKSLKPLLDVIAQMSDADVDYVLNACLDVCERQEGTGWARIRHQNGRMMYEDIEMPTMLQLAGQVVMENLSRFFPDPPAEKSA